MKAVLYFEEFKIGNYYKVISENWHVIARCDNVHSGGARFSILHVLKNIIGNDVVSFVIRRDQSELEDKWYYNITREENPEYFL